MGGVLVVWCRSYISTLFPLYHSVPVINITKFHQCQMSPVSKIFVGRWRFNMRGCAGQGNVPIVQSDSESRPTPEDVQPVTTLPREAVSNSANNPELFRPSDKYCNFPALIVLWRGHQVPSILSPLHRGSFSRLPLCWDNVMYQGSTSWSIIL